MKKFAPYLSNLLFIWAAVAAYAYLPYYQEFLSKSSRQAILYLSLAYTILGLVFYLKAPKSKIKDSKGLLALKFLKKILTKKPGRIKKEEKTATLFLAVKFFFLPIMLNFFFSNFNALIEELPSLALGPFFSISYFNEIFFPVAVTLIFAIDTAYFSFGYAFESKILKNTVRSVEPTLLGWAVALVCYPPFNIKATSIIDWFANIYIYLPNEYLTFILRFSIFLLLLIYLSATIALGPKSSNLTNRGIVSKGPYRFIRHPAYISKNLSWWLSIMPVLSWKSALSMAAWSLIYHLRSVTEERHLKQDKEYRLYMKKVKYRYIPFIY